MNKANRRIGRILLLYVALTILSSAIVGCEYLPESTFKLASESRLPKWIILPQGYTRADVSITMSYYDNPLGSNVKFTLQDAKGKILTKVYGNLKNSSPLFLKNPPVGFEPGYSAYEIVGVNGITEIIEHKKTEPIFYITDDPVVWKELMGVQPLAGGPVISPK